MRVARMVTRTGVQITGMAFFEALCCIRSVGPLAGDREDLRPDFMPVKMDGFADIVEFKLPWLKGKPVVGPATRTKPSAEVDTALAQIDEYEEWCAQDVNRRWLEEEKGIRVHAPMTYLVIGHQSEFTAEDRQRFRKRRNAIIVTYDEFVEMARHWSWVQ